MGHKNIESKARLQQTTRALRSCETHFRNIITKSPDGILIIDDSGYIKVVNPAAEVMLNRKGTALLGTRFGYPVVAGETTELEVVSTKQERTVVEMRVVEIEWEEKSAFLASLRDITESKVAVEQIKKHNEELKTKMSELDSANRELDAFNYTVAHDLRKPLTIINGYCQEVIEECANGFSRHCRDYLVEIYNGTVRMNELINALLDYSLLSRRELHRSEVQISTVAETIAAQLRLSAPGREVTFKIKEGIQVYADPDLLDIVLQKLFDNAWKYTTMRKHARIEFGVAETNEETVLFVKDNGAGFHPADAEKLFIPFQSLSIVDEKRGHRLGLATVSRIIKRHGGRVWAEGNIDKGATFYFTLPGGNDGVGKPKI